MKTLMNLAGLSLAILIAGPVSAIDLTPVPAAPGTVLPAPIHDVAADGPVYVDQAPIPLYTNVKYVDLKEMHPCAVPKIIRVNDPCACKDPCNCCGPQCVYIQICVPPCDCNEVVKCRKDGDRLRYDYGKYAVDVRVKKGFIVVDYQK
ncbi:MAG: hypothetical protein RIK87_03320 [Fuerstiella sp.]